MANISGTWLGTYWQQENPTRFEATFVQNGNTIFGNILDDGGLGEATVQGEVIGRKIRFVKTYVDANKKLASVNYNGTIAEDENSMSGKWDFFGRFGFESWEAQRSNQNLESELNKYIKNKVPVGV
ncbi:hypothetical protein H6F42_02555 [Pseudanabaena sp. FACHB-1998]|uniref:hypothetical protein n=1 Tax=Pseudanabaena sp. FACHB-1998 TaxID=2692858 RepID=UPI0016815A81|nr:hypothetical protein [Pseudanabaena sp. FACHB-1998]MBD2175799.1 hypothetical protein [Pseudanabaena sp. FACHB-1998]